MTAVFTDAFRTQLRANLALMNSAVVHWVYFSQAPSLVDNDSRYTGIDTLSDLTGLLGWGAALTPSTAAQTVGTITSGGNTYVVANNPFVMGGGWQESNVKVAALILEGSHGGVTNLVIMLTDTPFGNTVMGPPDSLSAAPDPAIAGNRWVIGWPVPPSGAPQVLPVEGPLSVLQAPPDFELSHAQHVWVYPQRVNMVANPSFEGTTQFWRAAGTLTRVSGGAPGGGAWQGSIAGTNPIAETNTFPLLIHPARDSDHWTIQAMVRGTGQVRIGLVTWPDTFEETAVDWGQPEEVWTLPADGYLHLYALRKAGENTTGMVRIECHGSALFLDNVLCEPDWLRDWPYFDGDTTYGAQGDYSWYGGENRKGKTYSLWYNHRRAVVGRLFAWSIPDDDFVVTDEEVEAQGFVYGWVPAGVRVIPHLDVLYAEDVRQQLPAVSGSVIPYKANSADLIGITNPWV